MMITTMLGRCGGCAIGADNGRTTSAQARQNVRIEPPMAARSIGARRVSLADSGYALYPIVRSRNGVVTLVKRKDPANEDESGHDEKRDPHDLLEYASRGSPDDFFEADVRSGHGVSPGIPPSGAS